MSARIFTHRLTTDEIQPIEVPVYTQIVGVDEDDHGEYLLCVGDFGQGSVTRFVTRARIRDKLPSDNLAYIGCPHKNALKEEQVHFFELLGP